MTLMTLTSRSHWQHPNTIPIYMSVYQESSNEVIDTLVLLFKIGYTKIIVRFDGTYNREIYEFCKANKILCLIGNNIKQKVGGGAITHEYLAIFLKYCKNDNYFAKIDPDTKPVKALTRLPEYIGSNISHKLRALYGGCLIYSRSFAKEVHESNILLSNEYKSSEWMYYHYNLGRHISSQDLILYDVLIKFDLLQHHDDMADILHCNNRIDRIDKVGIINDKYSFVHPKSLWNRITKNR